MGVAWTGCCVSDRAVKSNSYGKNIWKRLAHTCVCQRPSPKARAGARGSPQSSPYRSATRAHSAPNNGAGEGSLQPWGFD
jgi:hypothetical protein